MHLFKPKYKTASGVYALADNWAVEFRVGGKRKVKSLGTPNKVLANQRAKAILSLTGEQGWEVLEPKLPGKKSGVTIEQLIETYTAFGKSKGLTHVTVLDNSRYLKKFAREISSQYVHELSIEAFLQTDYARNLSDQTRAAVMRKVMSLFSKDCIEHYKQKGLTVEVPSSRRSLWRAKAPAPFIAPERESVLKLIALAERELLPQNAGMWLIFTLALQAGLRHGETLFLKWVDVRSSSVVIRSDETHRTKSGRTRVVPVSPVILQRIEPFRTKDEDFVVMGDRQRTARALVHWLKANGVKDRKPLHYLRKLFGALVATEHGLYAAKEYLGHSSVTVTEGHYADLLHKKTVQWGA